jgi:hypothetical protein
MDNLQEDHGAADSQNNRQSAPGCRSNPMHEVRSHGGCTDRGFECQSMSLNARCAKSVLKWISQSTTRTNQSAAGQT